MYFEFDPRKYRFAVEIGTSGVLERLDKVARPRPNEKVVMAVNWNVFDWTGDANNGYGEIEQDGKQLKPASADFPSMSFKDNKLTFGDLSGAQVGVGIAMTLILDNKIDIRNPAKMATGKDFRTACGQKVDGTMGLVTVENMTTLELATYMQNKGYVVAFQGDSGGSTGYYDGTLHDQGRPIAAALVVYEKKLIALDDGHGMETPGKRTPIFPGTTDFMHENEFNRAVVAYLKVHLERCGFNTLLVADGDADVPLRARTDLANARKADFYYSVHANALDGKWGPQEGYSTYHYPGSTKSNIAAIIIHRHLLKGTKQKDRGVLTENFHVLRETKMPSVLSEMAFMDNLKEAELLRSDAFRRECAEQAAQGICEVFGATYVPEQVAEDPFIQDMDYLAAKVGFSAEYWKKRKGIDPYFAELMSKFANYERRKSLNS